jgi:hypothetical protein
MMIDLEPFVGKTVVVTFRNTTTGVGVIGRNDGSMRKYSLKFPSWPIESYTREGYYWNPHLKNPLDIKSIELNEEPMIDLEEFVGKTVVVTREDGATKEGVIEINDNSNFPYKFRYPVGSFNTYTRDGYLYNKNTSSAANIKSIKLKDKDQKVVELRISQDFYDAVRILAEADGIKPADVIRSAVCLYTKVKKEKKKGATVAIVKVLDDSQLTMMENL